MADKSITMSRNAALCPICLEIPSGDIFQCKNGHMICSTCVKKVKKCGHGQCRAYFGKNPMRNRGVETILDDAQFRCTNENCTEVFGRKDLQSHKQMCQHREINVCQHLGYECEQNVDSAAAFCKHLKNGHFVGRQFYRCSRTLKNFLTEYIKDGMFRSWTDVFTSTDCEDFLANVQLSFKSEQPRRGAKVNGNNNGTLSITVLCLSTLPQKAKEYSGTVTVSTVYKSTMKTTASTWKTVPIHFSDKLSPCASIPVSLLKELTELRIKGKQPVDTEVDFDLVWEVSMFLSSQTTPSQPTKRAKMCECETDSSTDD